MKTFTLILFAVAIMISPIMAQHAIPRQELSNNRHTPVSVSDNQQNLNSSLMLLNSPNRHLKSTPSIKLDSIIISSRTSDSAPWKRYNKEVFIYDDKLRLVEISSTTGLYSWSNWPETAVFSYNIAGKVESIHLYSKIPDYPECCTRFNFTYDDLGRMLTAYSYNLYDGNWEINIGKNYSYDATGNVNTIFMEENWWAYWTSLHQYFYNNAGKLVRYENDFYSILTSYEWSPEGNLMELHYQSWYQKRDQAYEYDGNGNRLGSKREYSTKQWNSEVLTLQEKSSETYNYMDMNFSDLVDLNLSLLDQNNELDAVEYFPEKLLSTVNYRMDFSTYEMNAPKIQKSEYFYSPVPFKQKLISGIEERLNSTFSIYPNPASGHVTVTWTGNHDQLNLKIYQLTGTCVIDREIFSNETVNLEKLPKGAYFYKLSDRKEILKSGKLIIE